MRQYQISKKRFLDWLINDDEDHTYWGHRFISELKQDGIISITVKELFKERTDLPAHLFEEYFTKEEYLNSSFEDIPIEEIELVDVEWTEELEKCIKSYAYFFEHYVLIEGKKPSQVLIDRIKRKELDDTK